MKNEPIKVGDLVQVVRDCCGQFIGRVFVVGAIESRATHCEDCKTQYPEQGVAFNESWKRFDGHTLNNAPLSWLKRIPPLSELDDVRQDEEIEA